MCQRVAGTVVLHYSIASANPRRIVDNEITNWLMPLRAQLNGLDVIAPDLPDLEWVALRKAVPAPVLPCCGVTAGLRTSRRGLKHFFHKPRPKGSLLTADAANLPLCDWKPESEEHLRAKMEIVKSCREAGWAATPEARSLDGSWRADVLAEHGRKRIAFEVQLSPQRRDETEGRQARYAADGIRGCWFVKARQIEPSTFNIDAHFRNAAHELPAFPLFVDEPSTLRVGLRYGLDECAGMTVPLDTFVHALLTRQVHFATHVTATTPHHPQVIFIPYSCWSCGAKAHIYFVKDDPLPRSACGREVRAFDDSGNWEDRAFAPEIIRAVRAYVASPDGRAIRPGSIKKRLSKTRNASYLSFGCPRCDAIFGSHYLFDVITEATYTMAEHAHIVALPARRGLLRAYSPHWCYTPSGAGCT